MRAGNGGSGHATETPYPAGNSPSEQGVPSASDHATGAAHVAEEGSIFRLNTIFAGRRRLASPAPLPYAARAQSGDALAHAEHTCLDYGVGPNSVAFDTCVSARRRLMIAASRVLPRSSAHRVAERATGLPVLRPRAADAGLSPVRCHASDRAPSHDDSRDSGIRGGSDRGTRAGRAVARPAFFVGKVGHGSPARLRPSRRRSRPHPARHQRPRHPRAGSRLRDAGPSGGPAAARLSRDRLQLAQGDAGAGRGRLSRDRARPARLWPHHRLGRRLRRRPHRLPVHEPAARRDRRAVRAAAIAPPRRWSATISAPRSRPMPRWCGPTSSRAWC